MRETLLRHWWTGEAQHVMFHKGPPTLRRELSSVTVAALQVRRDALPEGHANIALAQLVLAKVLLMSRDGSQHRRGLAAAMECTDGLRHAAKVLHQQAQQAAQPQWSLFGGGAKDAAHPGGRPHC